MLKMLGRTLVTGMENRDYLKSKLDILYVDITKKGTSISK